MPKDRHAPLLLVRDCPATLIPSGTKMTLHKGDLVIVTQALGDTITITTSSGYLARIASEDADAIGLEVAKPEEPEVGDGPFDMDQVMERLKTVFDPEIPVNVVDLGLVYGCEAAALPDGGQRVEIRMSMTAPGCGMGDVLAEEARSKVQGLPGVRRGRHRARVGPAVGHREDVRRGQAPAACLRRRWHQGTATRAAGGPITRFDGISWASSRERIHAARWMRAQEALIPAIAASPPPAHAVTYPKLYPAGLIPSARQTTKETDSASSPPAGGSPFRGGRPWASSWVSVFTVSRDIPSLDADPVRRVGAVSVCPVGEFVVLDVEADGACGPLQRVEVPRRILALQAVTDTRQGLAVGLADVEDRNPLDRGQCLPLGARLIIRPRRRSGPGSRWPLRRAGRIDVDGAQAWKPATWVASCR